MSLAEEVTIWVYRVVWDTGREDCRKRFPLLQDIDYSMG